MARVPVYDTAQVAPTGMPTVRQSSVASPSLFSAGADRGLQAGKQLMAAGEKINDIAVDMQNRENADMLFRAETALKTEYIAFEQVARERRGAAAKDLTKEAADWWDKKQTEHSDNLANPTQKRLFAQQVARLRTQSLDGLSRYEADQRRAALAESTSASIVSSINLAASQVGTPTEQAAIMGAKADVLKRLDVLAKLNGYDGNTPEATALRDAKRAEALTNLHMQVIQNMVNSDPSRAKAYFTANKAEINGVEHEKIEGLYKAGTIREKAQKVADELTEAGMSEANGLIFIRQKLSGDEEAAAVLEWKTRHAEQTAARERAQKDAADQAYGIYARTGRFSAIPVDVLQKLDGRVLLALKKDAQSAAEGKMPKTDWDKYYELRQQAFTDPVAFAKRDLRGDFAYLGQAERKGMIDLQAAVRKPDELKDVATLENQLSNTHDLLGWGASDREKKGKFDTVVQQTIATEEKRTGKKLTFEERQKIIDRMVIERDNTALQFGTTRFYEVQGTENAATFTPRVPKEERAKIEAALRRAGRRVDDATVLELYRRKMGLPNQTSQGRVR